MVAILRVGEHARQLLPPQAATQDTSEGWCDGIGEPAAVLVDRWGSPSHHVAVVELAASCAAMWGRQLAQVHLDLRAIKVHDIPFERSTEEATDAITVCWTTFR